MQGSAVLGRRFVPTDVELITYLKKRVEGSKIPPALIHECDVYAQEPWNLPRDFMRGVKEEVYYFTPRHRASAKVTGCRVNRNAGEGFWHGNGRDQLIVDDEHQNSGHKTSLVFKFRDNKRKRLHTTWIMHEYILHSSDGGEFQEMALCRINPKREKKEVGDHHPATYGSKTKRIHTTMSMPLFDQAQEASSDGVAKVTATWTEQETASQLMPLPELVVDSSTDTNPSSTSHLSDSDIWNWIDSTILPPLPSPTPVPSGGQYVEMNDADAWQWIDSSIAIENSIVAQSSPFATDCPINHPTITDDSGWATNMEARDDI